MAKEFAGFTKEQRAVLLKGMGYKGPMQDDDIKKFLAADPKRRQRMASFVNTATKMVNGGLVKGFNEGGVSDAKTFLDNAQASYSTSLKAQQDARDALAADPTNEELVKALEASNSAVVQQQEALNQAQSQYQATDIDSTSEMLGEINKDPTSKVTTADVATTTQEQTDAGTIDADAGQADVTAEQATTTQGVAQPDATTPTQQPANTYDATTTEDAVKEIAKNTEAAQGTVSDQAQVTAQTGDPSQMSQLDLDASQIDQAQTVADVEDRKVEEGEMIEGSTVDMDEVRKEVNFEAATGSPSSDATVQGQLTGLMEDFEGKDPPPWAAGAMRQAAAAMAARGLSSSSMAGQAMIQAAMESAIPIAQQDASTFAKFEAQNLSNKQQSAMFAAEKRAEFLGLEFTQDFQARVANASKISDIANMNFTADQQVALENAKMAQSVDIANLSASNAKVLADAAAMSQMDMANLNNRQQAAVQNAKSFLQMDMANLDNEQATSIFKAQQLVASLFNDQSAQNAAAQFNATSENQTDQFFAKLASQTDQFNINQKNAMEQFNAGEANAIEKFNTQQLNAREEFNASNSLIVEQANAKWMQTIATTDNAAINQANRDEAQAANGLTNAAFNAMLQESRDIMSYAWQGANNDADRITSLAIAKISSEDAKEAAAASRTAGFWGAIGNIGASLFRGYLTGGAGG